MSSSVANPDPVAHSTPVHRWRRRPYCQRGLASHAVHAGKVPQCEIHGGEAVKRLRAILLRAQLRCIRRGWAMPWVALSPVLSAACAVLPGGSLRGAAPDGPRTRQCRASSRAYEHILCALARSAHSALPGALLLVTLEYCKAFITAPKLAGILCLSALLVWQREFRPATVFVDRKQHAHSNYMRSLRKRMHSS